MSTGNDESRGFVRALVGDGRPLISLTAIYLALSGDFAILPSANGHDLPYDNWASGSVTVSL